MGSFTGLLGIFAILGLAYLASADRRAINWRLVISGLILQLGLALFILKVPFGQSLFQGLAHLITRVLSFANDGGAFVFGPLVNQPDTLEKIFGPGGRMIFAFSLVPTIIFMATLVSMAYHVGLMQQLVRGVAWLVSRIMGASGAEALSNAASIFVGQVEAQLMIKPYVPSLTQSELLAVMAGSMACISGGIMGVYIGMGIPAQYLLTASLMAAPGALVISKIVLPETQVSATQGDVRLEVERTTVNLLDAAAHGASDGMRIGIQVVGSLIAFTALIALINWLFGLLGLALDAWNLSGHAVGLDFQHLTLNAILGRVFSGLAFLLGVPWRESQTVGGLMGTKLVANEFLAYSDLTGLARNGTPLSPKAMAIASFALCGFANLSSVAIQISGIGEIAPSRKADLARLGIKALLCGTAASYISGAIAGMLL